MKPIQDSDYNIVSNRKAYLNLKFSEFEVPPMQDVLIIGKQAPIGPEAARRMADALSPEQYEVLDVEHDVIEALVVNISLLRLVPRSKLVPIVMSEGEHMVSKSVVLKVQMNVSVQVSREVEL